MKQLLYLGVFLCISTVASAQAFEGEIVTYWKYAAGAVILLFIIIRWTRSEPEKELDAVHKHKYFHFTDFQLSAEDFYTTLQKIIEERAFPHVTSKIVTLSTGGFLSNKRIYLEVNGSVMTFFVCAAPFGKNFFISYWLRDIPDGCTTTFFRRVLGMPDPPKTFYDIDSQAMFVEGITTAISVAIQTVTEDRGLRKLQDAELIPKIAS